jgi:hypothetical protein
VNLLLGAKNLEGDCIYQILTDSALNDCRTEAFPDKVFIRRVGQHWAISTYNSSKCHSVAEEDLDQHILIDNEEVTLPEIALITTDDEKSLACDRFIILKAPVKVGQPINLIINESINPSYKTLISVIIVLIFYIYCMKKTGGSNTNITISMPSMKELETREA